MTRIHGINIIWAFAPKRYAIEYSRDGNNYKTLIDWRDAVQGGNKSWWESLIPSLRTAYRSFPDRITFDYPVFAIKVRILMKGPVNYYFGLYRVDIFIRNWILVIKNTPEGQAKEDCWVINTVVPKLNTPVKTSDCVHAIGYSENRELFVLLYDSRLVHYNSGLCVTSGNIKDIHLEDCNQASGFCDGRNKFYFWEDGRITPHYARDECIHRPVDAKPLGIEQEGVAEATSEIADGGHSAYRAIDGNEGSYWASNPGDEIATITIYFRIWMTMEYLNINWKYEPQNFEVYAYTLENGWRLILKVTGNSLKQNRLKLKRINARAIQIKMSKTKNKILKLPIYAINGIEITDGSISLKRKPCNTLGNKVKQWILDDQFYYYIGNKPPYIEAYNALTRTYLELKKRNRKINIEFLPSKKAKTKAQQLTELLKDTKKKLHKLLAKIKLFQTEKYSWKNNDFESLLLKFNLELFYPYAPKAIPDPLHIGNISSNPGLDCWHIKKKSPTKKSGFYWIKTSCTKKAIRVYCDFSVDGLGTSIYVYKTEMTNVNSAILDVDVKSAKDIKKLCAQEGLHPIEINNHLTIYRITQYLQFLGHDLKLPIVYPLGYDFSCDKGSCSLSYKSISSADSNDVFGFFPTPDASEEHYNRFTKHNSIGLGYHGDGKPFFFNINTAKNVGGVICSTNEHKPPISDPTEASLQCSDIASGNSKVDGTPGSKIKINCPSYCKEKSEHKIYGADTYSDNSSICRAAIHSGFIKDADGGSVTLVIGGPVVKYQGSVANSITSNDSGKTEKSFSFEKFQQKCPIDFFKSEEEKEKEEAAGGAAKAEDERKEDQKEAAQPPKLTQIAQSPSKTHPFNSETKGYKGSLEKPLPRPTVHQSYPNSGIDLGGISFVGRGGSIGVSGRAGVSGGIGVSGRGDVSGRAGVSGGIGVSGRGGVSGRAGVSGGIGVSGIGGLSGKLGLSGKEGESGKAGVSGKLGLSGKVGVSGKLGVSGSVGVSGGLANAPGVQSVSGSQSTNLALNATTNKDIIKAKVASNTSRNPAKSEDIKKKAEQKEPPVINTDMLTREIVDYRDLDYIAFKHFNKFREQMKELMKEFEGELAFSVYPSKLSNLHLSSTIYFNI